MPDTIRLSTDSMEEIYTQLRQLQSELAAQSNAVRALANSVDELSGGDLKLRMNLRLACGSRVSGNDVKSVLGSLNRTLGACGDESGRIGRAVSSAESMFRDNERRIVTSLDKRSDGMVSFAGKAPVLAGARTGAVPAAKSTGIDWQLNDLIKSLITSAGMGGEFFYSLATAGAVPGGLSKFLVTGAKCVGEWKDIVHGFSKLKNFGTGYAARIYAKRIFGLNSFASSMGFTASKASSFSGRFFSNLSRSGAFKQGMKSTAAWAVEGIERGIENYQEYAAGYKDGGTALAEWACETAVGVTATAATVAAVGAAAAGAPAIAVTAAAGVIVWGVDTLWANTLGRGKDEDGGNEGLIETIGEGMVECGKGIASATAQLAAKTKSFFTGISNIRVAWAQ